jgi:hypothetical protein
MSTLALTQCWYTREHHPAHKPRDRVDGAFYAQCRHCRRAIFSIDGNMWHIDGGFNVETLGDAATSFLSIDDPDEGMTIARIPISPAASEEDVDALIDQVRKDYAIGEEGTSLILRDHRHHKPRRVKKVLRGVS